MAHRVNELRRKFKAELKLARKLGRNPKKKFKKDDLLKVGRG